MVRVDRERARYEVVLVEEGRGQSRDAVVSHRFIFEVRCLSLGESDFAPQLELSREWECLRQLDG